MTAVCLLVGVFAAACGHSGSSEPGGDTSGTSTAATAGAKTFRICPGDDAQKQALVAFFDAREGDTIEFCAGEFAFDSALVMTGKRGITVKGAGRDRTILSFRASSSQDGISINRVDGITVADLTIYDAPGNGLRIFRSSLVTIRGVKIGWSDADPASANYDPSMKSWVKNGSYAFYPVICRHVLIEDSISVGSSDAGVYVGQSSDIVVRRTEAFHNVAGFEFENTYRAEFVDNVAHDNVGGFLVFDLPGRVQFGEKNRVHHNRTFHNNLPSFAPRGAIVGDVPSGSGILVFASDQLELHDNEITDNRTVGLAILNYGLADAKEASTRYDFYPEGIHVYGNLFRDNGLDPELPDLARDSCRGIPGLPPGLPNLAESPDCLTNNPSLVPLILRLKNAGKSAQIIWDGGVDHPNDCTEVPRDRFGVPLDEPDPNDTDRPEPRVDERGRPNLDPFDPTPTCKWNAWKFDANGRLKRPQNGFCIENNRFATTHLSLPVDDFANVHFSTADPTNPANLPLADNAMPHDCPTVAPELLAKFTPDLGSFTPNPASDPRPTDAEIAAACDAVESGKINYDAVASVDCPRLDQYGLFADPGDPRRDPNGFGVPFDLNTPLFSDYASKYRFLFLPPDDSGKPQKAGFQDHTQCDTLNVFSCLTATLEFPVGTVFAKTFSFKNGADEDVVETRLLIKRRRAAGDVFWVGLPYVWVTDGNGARHADLRIEGDTKSVRYDYDDADPEVVDAAGKRVHYSGGTDHYAVPNAGACILCHNGDDLEPGSPPIGPKVRNLNKDHEYADVGVMNQLAYLQSKALLDLPDEPSKLEKLAKWNVPGSGGKTAGSAADVHQRARAFLEVNCMHCHNRAGNASNSGLSLDSFQEPMDAGHGICKPPIAAGRAADFGNYDIQPGDAGVSILPHRLASVEPGIRMPPVSRSVMQKEAVELVTRWVDDVVAGFADPKANTCGSNGLPIPLKLP